MSKVPPMWGPQSYVTVEEGDLVIFPSFFEHRVARQTTDELRVTLSFNFNFL
jgi:predicted 2-oxoglutarate/Fe(II)-dependent dioxygenase YbiX